MIARLRKPRWWIALTIFSLAVAGLVIVSLPKTDPKSEIEKLGGEIALSSEHSAVVSRLYKLGMWLNDKEWRRSAGWLVDISHSFSPAVSVDLHGKGVTDEDLVHLKDLTKLTYLNLSDNPISGAGLDYLTGLTERLFLLLNETQVSDAGLEHLSGLNKLWALGLGGTQVTDSGLAHLDGLTHLKSLTLGNTRVTDAGLPQIKKLSRLTFLSLNGTRVSVEGRGELMKANPGLQIP